MIYKNIFTKMRFYMFIIVKIIMMNMNVRFIDIYYYIIVLLKKEIIWRYMIFYVISVLFKVLKNISFMLLNYF